MEDAVARGIAHFSHVGQRTRHGMPVIEHVERVASTVPVEARSVAFLHDVLEQTETGVAELRERGLTQLELDALELLTRGPAEPYDSHVLRIACAEGPAASIARTVKLADLDDHLTAHRRGSSSPPYAWARHHIVFARRRRGEVAEAVAASRVSSVVTTSSIPEAAGA